MSKGFRYEKENNLVWYDTTNEERNNVVVHEGDYKGIEDVKNEFNRYLDYSRMGILGKPKNAEDLYIFIYACSKGWISK